MRYLLTALLMMTAAPVAAHGTMPGGSGFYTGLAHPFVAVEHGMLLISFGLLCGRMAGAAVGPAALALLIGLWAGLVGQGLVAVPLTVPLTLALMGLTLVFGAILVVSPALPLRVIQAGALLAGALIGIDTDGVHDVAQPLTTAFSMAGVGIGTLLIALNTAALSRFLSGRGWSIVTRIAGSWICAVAVLMLALTKLAVTP